MWHITNQKYGANALGLQRLLGLDNYRTAWEWLHRFRRAMVRPDRDRLSGCIQVDETYLGGTKPGKRGRGAAGKALVAIAVEDKGDNRIGRIRLQHIPNASAASLENFIKMVVQSSSTVKIRTDGWVSYGKLPTLGYSREVLESKEMKLPHLVASLMKRWLLGTYQGAVRPSHLAYYLDEYTFRFNRRKSHYRGKLFFRLVQQALRADSIPRQQLKASLPSSPAENFDDLNLNGFDPQ